MFGTRLFSGIILVLIAIVTIAQGGIVLLATVGIISVIGQFELYRAVKLEKSCMAYIGYGMTVILYILLFLKPVNIRPSIFRVSIFSFPVCSSVTETQHQSTV